MSLYVAVTEAVFVGVSVWLRLSLCLVSVSVSVLCVTRRQGQVVHASVTQSVIFVNILVIAVTEPLNKLH